MLSGLRDNLLMVLMAFQKTIHHDPFDFLSRSNQRWTNKMEKCQVILQVTAAGGKLTLYGRQTQNGWLFSRQVIDQTPDLLDETAVNHNSGVVNSWTAALELMDHYRWHMLNPVTIHVAFRDAIIQVVESRLKGESDSGSPRLADWLTHCNVDGRTQ